MMSGAAVIREDRDHPGIWRVEWTDDRANVEVAIFAGPNAHDRAIRCANLLYDTFTLVPTPDL